MAIFDARKPGRYEIKGGSEDLYRDELARGFKTST